MIPMLNLSREFASMRDEMMQAIEGVCETAMFINGPEVKKFESEVATYLNVQNAIGCASGTDALQLALMVLEIGPGDEVITTPFTFVATVEVVRLLGATPVFVDIEPNGYTIDADLIESAITEKTKAIVPVHLFGQCADMEKIMAIAKKHNLAVIEDCAQSIGATQNGLPSGTMGEFGCFSFFPSKNLGCYGDGGMVISNDAKLAGTARAVGNHGMRTNYRYEMIGVNSRLDAIQSTVLRVKLRHLDKLNKNRQRVAKEYETRMADLPIEFPKILDGNTHIYHQYCIQIENRDGLVEHLKKSGIACAIYYPAPLSKFPLYGGGEVLDKSLPISEKVSGKIMALPIDPHLTSEEIIQICSSIRKFFND